MTLDYTEQGRKPTIAQIIADWKRGGCPSEFEVTYGETYARFIKQGGWGQVRWFDDGNGCRGVNRLQVVTKLNNLALVGDKS